MPETAPIRPATTLDRDFIPELAERFAAVPLTPGREAASVLAGARRDIAHHLDAATPRGRCTSRTASRPTSSGWRAR